MPPSARAANASATSCVRAGVVAAPRPIAIALQEVVGMSAPDPLTAAESPRALAELNAWLAGRTAGQRVAWALENLSGGHALSSSFGAQAAVSLHMATRQKPDMPVILIDTGYLFPETYRFVDELVQTAVARPARVPPADRHRVDGSALRAAVGAGRSTGWSATTACARWNRCSARWSELGVRCWIAGLRRSQSRSRANVDFLELRDGRWKLHPIADWSDRDVFDYLSAHALPYHPLWQRATCRSATSTPRGRSSRAWSDEDTRFFGLKRECGLHERWEGEGRAA